MKDNRVGRLSCMAVEGIAVRLESLTYDAKRPTILAGLFRKVRRARPEVP
jgi:hypothetical protein